jgi:hypothetical protein
MLHVFSFGLEILRLVYKKAFFKILIGFYIQYILFELLTSKKTAPSLIRVLKKFLRNWVCKVSKEAEFWADFKNVQQSQVWQKGKTFLQKN